MKLKDSLIKNLSIVLIGNFNPAIVTPHWLASKKAIRESEAENAVIKIIHPEISDFKISFVELQVSQDKFIINCNNEADFDLAKDLIISIFTFLNETPVTGIGINHITHFSFEGPKEYNDFGNWLSPHDIWSDELKDPKLLELKVVEPFTKESSVKNLVSISTSDKITHNGVRFQLNYHIEINREKIKSLPGIFQNHWERSQEKSTKVFNSIIEKFYA